MTVSNPPPLLGRVPPSIPCAPPVHLQEKLNLLPLCPIAGAQIKDETGGYHSYAKRECQVNGGCRVEPWGAGENPGGYDSADVNRGQADRDRRCAAEMRLYVVRVPRDEAGSGGITTYDLKI